ncbi:MAG: patatin-like phospholipase family protein [Proteobacteria bacterium]|nr:patatin-like phospholipase family protein [Pseudomonadota bacterium]
MTTQASLDAVHALERAWLRDRALSPDALDDAVISTYHYAMRLSGIRNIATSTGLVEIAPHLDGFRSEFLTFMRVLSARIWQYCGADAFQKPGTIAWKGQWFTEAVIQAYPDMKRLLGSALSGLYQACPQIDAHDIENAVGRKKLVLALGGGGGTGFAHLCLFQWLEELGIQPSLITGTSIGALLGLLRALQTHFNADVTFKELPSLWNIIKCLRPGFGTGKHGLMGIFRIDLNNILLHFAELYGWDRIPTLKNLKIPFASMSSGILNQSGLPASIESKSSGLLRTIAMFPLNSIHKTIRHTVNISSIVSSHHATKPISFGFDPLTETMTSTDAVSFSMLVPGVLNYEMPRNHYRSREIMNQIFAENNLYRLCDGGLASNVPVRTARDAVDKHILGQETAYILGLDVFAPQSGDPLFYPLQMIANKNATVDASFADSFVRLKHLLDPIEISPIPLRLYWLNMRFRHAFADEMKIIRYAMRPLLPLIAVV